MSEVKINTSSTSRHVGPNSKEVWVTGKKINTFAYLLDKAIANKGKSNGEGCSGTKKNIVEPQKLVLTKKIVLRKKKSKKSKLSKQKDCKIVNNFLNKILLPMMKDAYISLENLEKNKYKQKEALIGVLNKKSLNEGDMVEGVVYEWNDSAKTYKVLVGKNGDSLAWAYISDEDEKKQINKGDKVYFVVVKNSSGKSVLKEYYPQTGDLNIDDIINLQFANVKIEKMLKTTKDSETGEEKTKKIGMGHISISLGDYVGIIKKTLLPKGYKPGKSLKVKIKEITKNGNRLLLKFDEEFLKEKVDEELSRRVDGNTLDQKVS